MNAIAEKLKSKGLKATPQRIAIYNMLSHTDSHPGAEDIYDDLRDDYPGMSLATVYKTVDSFRKVGLAWELNMGDDNFRYDARSEPHAHFRCTVCGAIYDLPQPAELEDIAVSLKKKYGHTAEVKQLFLYGSCAKCADK